MGYQRRVHGEHNQARHLLKPKINQSIKSIKTSSQHTQAFTMDTIKNAANYVSESISGACATASKEANKNVAKDSDANLSPRAQAAGDAISDKFDEQTHDRKADVHKEAAKHWRINHLMGMTHDEQEFDRT